MRVLIVEHDRDLLESISASLREEGYLVEAVADGERGLRQALDDDYDAVILDAKFPTGNGWDLLSRLRKKKSTPVMMVTSKGQIRDRARNPDDAADDYVVKPFDFEELTERLRAIIRRHAVNASNIIEIGTVTVNPARRLVYRAGLVVDLTPREYLLVEFLALHRGRVITREQLFEHLAHGTEDTGSNLLDVHVFNVRKKLGAELVTTRRGHGYCIE